MNIFDKAAAAGLDPRQIEKAQQPMTCVQGQQLESHEAMDRVILHAAMYDYPGQNIRCPRLGIGAVVHDFPHISAHPDADQPGGAASVCARRYCASES